MKSETFLCKIRTRWNPAWERVEENFGNFSGLLFTLLVPRIVSECVSFPRIPLDLSWRAFTLFEGLYALGSHGHPSEALDKVPQFSYSPGPHLQKRRTSHQEYKSSNTFCLKKIFFAVITITISSYLKS